MNLQLPPVFEYQRQALFGIERYAVVEGTTKCGKSWGCLIWLLEEAGRFRKVDANFWWVAPTQAQAEIMYSRTKAMMLAADPNKTCWDSHDTKYRITIKGCGFLWFKTGEKPDTLYGEDVYGAVMDEFTRQRHEAWIALRTTLSATKGRCRFIGNVKGRQNWGYQWARKAEAGAANMSYSKITCVDAVRAGIMDQDEVDQAEQDLPHDVFMELYYAEASDDGSNPFGLDAIKACTHEGANGVCAGHEHCEPVAWGWDLARARDWTVGIGLCEHDQVCRFERWNRSSMPGLDTSTGKAGDSHKRYWKVTLHRVRKATGMTPGLVDSTGPGGPIDLAISEEALNIEGYVFSSQSKQRLMEGLAITIQSQEVGFPEGQITTELDLFGYEYSDHGRRVSYTTMEGAPDDCVCALALAVESKKRHATGRSKALVFDAEDLKDREIDAGQRRPVQIGSLTHLYPAGREQDLSIAAAHIADMTFEEDARDAAAGPLKLWVDLENGRPPRNPYCLFVVAGDGQGRSPGIVTIADCITRAIVAQWVKLCPPERLARAAAMLALWFGQDEQPAAVQYLSGEMSNPGGVFGQQIARLHIGGIEWCPTPAEFAEEIGMLRAAWDSGQFQEKDPAVFAVARQYIRANQTMMHASLAGQPERRSSHADLLMNRAGLWRQLAAMPRPGPQDREAPPGSVAAMLEERARKQRAAKGIVYG